MDGLLKQELRNLRVTIDNQINVIKARAGEGNPMELMNMNGDYIMIPLLVAKAQVLSALVNLEKK